MQLIEGIKIKSALNCLKDRLKISEGSYLTKTINGVVCKQTSYLPIDKWQDLNSVEYNLLTNATSNTDRGKTIGLIDTSGMIAKNWHDLLSFLIQNQEEAQLFEQTNDYQKFLAEITKVIDFYKLTQDYVLHHLCVKKANLYTVTYNNMQENFIGLHIDSWEGREFENRGKVRNRLCINFSKESRYFFFVNLPIEKIKAIVEKQQSHYTNRVNVYDYIYAFLASNPNYPICRLEIKPLEAYIAPTENIIHDGSTMGNKHPDIHLTIRGFFDTK
jgi:hypothetical protein